MFSHDYLLACEISTVRTLALRIDEPYGLILKSLLKIYVNSKILYRLDFQVSSHSFTEGSMSPGQTAPAPTTTRPQAPSGEEVLPLLQKQGLYIQQLEGENRYAKV